MAQRGIIEPDEVESYLAPTLASLADPNEMADMPAAVERLIRALHAGESITIYGDYDVDGVCATTVLVDFLRRVGGRVSFYIPDRRNEGYGLNPSAIRELASHTRLLVAVDCGITAVREVELANQLGVDVIVVDHHHVAESLPPSIANLNPNRPDCPYPGKNLCAAGVAFMLAAAVRRALREAGQFSSRPQPDVRELLDVVALATVADMVPLRGTNRTLVAAGLKRMAISRRLGLRALLDVSKVDPDRVTATDLAFRLGPRINARGRISRAGEAVELLLTSEPSRARMLAAELDAANRARRDIERHTLEQAIRRADSERLDREAGIVLADPSWHPGVVGLVATRLVGRYMRPAIVIGEGGKGSGRTFEGLNLLAAIEANAEYLVRCGGHPAAAGITISEDQIEPFSRGFAAAVREQLGDPPFVASLEPDLEVTDRLLSLRMFTELRRLEPFGQANPEPLLVARGLRVTGKRVVGECHLKLRLGEADHDAIAFGFGDLAAQVPECVDVAFRLMQNDYGGRTRVQLKVEDLRAAV
jgi:single-stranded-DNA-specific exonuclease